MRDPAWWCALRAITRRGAVVSWVTIAARCWRFGEMAMTASTLAARYVARRTVLVTGGLLAAAASIERPLVAAGVEVHIVTNDPVDRPSRGVASYNVCDLGSVDAIAAAMRRIGAVVQNAFHVAVPIPGHDDRGEAWHAFVPVANAVSLLMPTGGTIVGVGPADAIVDDFVREASPALAAKGIRLVTVPADDSHRLDFAGLQQAALSAGVAGLA